jgi:hypothetical protein
MQAQQLAVQGVAEKGFHQTKQRWEEPPDGRHAKGGRAARHNASAGKSTRPALTLAVFFGQLAAQKARTVSAVASRLAASPACSQQSAPCSILRQAAGQRFQRCRGSRASSFWRERSQRHARRRSSH